MSGYRRRQTHLETRAQVSVPAPTARPRRRARVLPVFAAGACLAFVAAAGIPQSYSAEAAPMLFSQSAEDYGQQTFQVTIDAVAQETRDAYGVTKPPPPKPAAVASTGSGRAAPAAGTPDPGSAQAIAHDMVLARGWSEDEYSCLVALWNKESHWNVYAHNKSSGAYGIPQALPGNKMASVGADWETNPATQITWGLGYISGRYSTPCGAWASSQSRGWY